MWDGLWKDLSIFNGSKQSRTVLYQASTKLYLLGVYSSSVSFSAGGFDPGDTPGKKNPGDVPTVCHQEKNPGDTPQGGTPEKKSKVSQTSTICLLH